MLYRSYVGISECGGKIPRSSWISNNYVHILKSAPPDGATLFSIMNTNHGGYIFQWVLAHSLAARRLELPARAPVHVDDRVLSCWEVFDIMQ